MMTKLEARKAAFYLDRIIVDYGKSHDKLIPVTRDPDGNSLAHLRWMCAVIRREVKYKEMSTAKTMRWLGYIQGGLVFWGIATLDQMKQVSLNAVTKKR